MFRIFVVAVALTLCSLSAYAQGTEREEVDLALVLAVDVSGSVTEERFQIQQQGYVAAFRHPAVIDAILTGGPNSRIAITLFFWSNPSNQKLAIPWRVLDSPQQIRQLADDIEALDRPEGKGGTSISGAIALGVTLLTTNRFLALRRVIDVSGDGINSADLDTQDLPWARQRAYSLGITVNGLSMEPAPTEDALLRKSVLQSEHALIQSVENHYRDEVITGPGSFLIPIQSPGQFPEAIRRKLVLEIALRE